MHKNTNNNQFRHLIFQNNNDNGIQLGIQDGGHDFIRKNRHGYIVSFSRFLGVLITNMKSILEHKMADVLFLKK